jgi:hypothetical protein
MNSYIALLLELNGTKVVVPTATGLVVQPDAREDPARV